MVTTVKDNPVANYIVMVVVSLMAIGTVFVFSAGANIGQDLDLQKFYNYPCLRQILFFPLACLIMFAVSCFDYRRFSLASVSSVEDSSRRSEPEPDRPTV
jgi:cell division protein FtsW (lipid II flippase)